MRNLQTRPDVTIKAIHTTNEALDEAEQVLVGYIQHLLDVRIRSVGFLDVVRHLHAVS
jgi:hypothetical protein